MKTQQKQHPSIPRDILYISLKAIEIEIVYRNNRFLLLVFVITSIHSRTEHDENGNGFLGHLFYKLFEN